MRGDRPLLEQVQIKRLEEAVSLATTRLTNAMEKEDSAKLALAQAEGKARQTYLVIDTPIAASKPEVSRKNILVKAVLQGVERMEFISVGSVAGKAVNTLACIAFLLLWGTASMSWRWWRWSLPRSR